MDSHTTPNRHADRLLGKVGTGLQALNLVAESENSGGGWGGARGRARGGGRGVGAAGWGTVQSVLGVCSSLNPTSGSVGLAA